MLPSGILIQNFNIYTSPYQHSDKTNDILTFKKNVNLSFKKYIFCKKNMYNRWADKNSKFIMFYTLTDRVLYSFVYKYFCFCG